MRIAQIIGDKEDPQLKEKIKQVSWYSLLELVLLCFLFIFLSCY